MAQHEGVVGAVWTTEFDYRSRYSRQDAGAASTPQFVPSDLIFPWGLLLEQHHEGVAYAGKSRQPPATVPTLPGL
jgi:hypothetical protein